MASYFTIAENAKWKSIADDEDLLATKPAYAPDAEAEAEALIQAAYASEMAQEQQVDRLTELKIKLAVDAYEKRRPADKIMHHYWIKEAGDPEAVGEYYPTGDERCDAPVYRNQQGMILSRERQPMGPHTNEECFGWVLGNMAERRPLYGVQSDDLSVPTLGWQAFTAPEPLPIIRYYTHASAARVFKEKGNTAFHKKDWAEAEDWYSKALACKMDTVEYAEPLGMLLSNRAEARLRLLNFTGAAADAENAMKYLRTVIAQEEATKMLKQKTVVRWAKAMQALKSFPEALSLLQAEKRNFSESPEIERLIEEIQLAQGPSKLAAGKGSATSEMLKFLSETLDTLQQDIVGLGAKLSDTAFPSSCASSFKKLEYILSKAKGVQGACLSDLQTVMRANGGLRMLQQVILAQWKANLDGKMVDTFQLPAAASVAAIVGLSCDACPENIKIVSSEAHCYFSMLGGCNQKVDKDTCEVLISLASGLMEHGKVKTIDLIQTHSIVVERAAAFLSKASLAEPSADGAGFDSPSLVTAAKEQAAALLFELFAVGGRVEKRALRGAVPQLSGPHGYGFFTADSAPVRALGESVAYKAIADPSLISSAEVRNLIKGADLLLCSADVKDQDIAITSFEGSGPDAKMRYVNLQGFEATEDGQHCALLLKAMSTALEFRLLRKGRELERDSFENAFHEGGGYYVVIPLLQGPAAFAEPALLCLATLAQTSLDNLTTIVGLSVFHILIGIAQPTVKPMPSYIDETFKTSAACRKSAAKLLAKAVETQVAIELLRNAGEKCIKGLVKLASSIQQQDGLEVESFYDMLQVFYVISETRPGPLCLYMPDDLMNIFVEMAQRTDETDVTMHARSIIQMLLKDPACEKKVLQMNQRAEGSRTYDPEDELLEQLTPSIGRLV
jgi:tetratricopeptide (TPR) repeat protein